MLQDGTQKDDVRVPEGDLGKQIQDDFDAGKDLLVTIVSAMGEEQVSHLLHAVMELDIQHGYTGNLLQRSTKGHLISKPSSGCVSGVSALSSVGVSCWRLAVTILRSFVLIVFHLSDSSVTTHSFALYFSLYHDEGIKI